MPIQTIDYSKTIIYKIVCKDVNITDCYVGSTTDFVRRKNQHKNLTNKSNLYVYEFMRENGNWENWEMIEIEKYNAIDHNEGLKRERYWLEELKATLNKNIPCRLNKEYYEINKESINKKSKEYKKEWEEKHKDIRKEQKKEWKEANPEYNKEYYETNKDQILERIKENYQNNREVIQQRRQTKITCECGCIIGKQNMLDHKRSQKHAKIMKTLL